MHYADGAYGAGASIRLSSNPKDAGGLGETLARQLFPLLFERLHHAASDGFRRARLGAPRLEAIDLRRFVEVRAALGPDDPSFRSAPLGHEVGKVIR